MGSKMRAAERVTQPKDELTPEARIAEHRALIARVAAERDRAAFQALFLHFGPRIKAMLMKSGADHAMAEDLAQDVMMTVWRKVDLYVADRGTVSGWIFTIARNARIDRLRRGVSQPYVDVESIELASDAPSAEDDVAADQQALHVTSALQQLPEEQRKIIEFAYIKGMPQSEIAEKLALPLGTVKSRMRLAYAKMREKLEDIR